MKSKIKTFGSLAALLLAANGCVQKYYYPTKIKEEKIILERVPSIYDTKTSEKTNKPLSIEENCNKEYYWVIIGSFPCTQQKEAEIFADKSSKRLERKVTAYKPWKNSKWRGVGFYIGNITYEEALKELNATKAKCFKDAYLWAYPKEDLKK